MSFDPLGLSPELLRAVADEGYVTPTPVQGAAIPLVLAGRDVLAGAQTGTGKTAAFVLPILQRLHERPARPVERGSRPPVRVLVLVPTRELALQVEASVRTYGARRPVRSVAIYGGVGYDAQLRALRRGVDIVVATPGRLIDHLEQGSADLGRVETLVLDEADRMLDMGFIRDIRRIVALLPTERQTLLFSATFSDDVRRLAAGLLVDPAHVQVTPRNAATDLVRQVVIRVDRERKQELLTHLVRSGRIDQALVFVRTKHGATRLAERIERDGIAAAAIHGNRSQSQRVRALADFKAGRIAILVATEVAARGIDIEALPHVVNFELPMVPADYVHRIGRTGRAGTEGDAISLVCVDEGRLLRDIEDLLGRRIDTEVVPGFEPDPRIRPEAIRLRTGAAPLAHRAAPHRSISMGGATGPQRPQRRQRQEAPHRSAGAHPSASSRRSGTHIGQQPPAPALRETRRPTTNAGRTDRITLPGERFAPRPATLGRTR